MKVTVAARFRWNLNVGNKEELKMFFVNDLPFSKIVAEKVDGLTKTMVKTILT